MNVVDNLGMHFIHQLQAPSDLTRLLFKKSHLQSLRGKSWHEVHKKVFDATQQAFSSTALAATMNSFNLDISLVLQDAAMMAPSQNGDNPSGVSAPKANSNASQNLSLLHSIASHGPDDDDTTECPLPLSRLVDPSTSFAAATAGTAATTTSITASTATTIEPVAISQLNQSTLDRSEEVSAITARTQISSREASTVTSTPQEQLDLFRQQYASDLLHALEKQRMEFQNFLEQQQAKTAHPDGSGPAK
jgi:hypothetical protein